MSRVLVDSSERPVLDPERVTLTAHVVNRYRGRRHNGDPEAGLRRLLAKAALRPTPPLRCVGEHQPHRLVVVSGFCLVFDQDMRRLVTLWRSGRG